ncbi:hypothetical protein GCM10009744_26430 [Kribbella alba]|uniref:Uncharacterized protein n=1 Tax=Kribbella alba TaxID=190197 RepID=A0ABN2F959_9ACTN
MFGKQNLSRAWRMERIALPACLRSVHEYAYARALGVQLSPRCGGPPVRLDDHSRSRPSGSTDQGGSFYFLHVGELWKQAGFQSRAARVRFLPPMLLSTLTSGELQN